MDMILYNARLHALDGVLPYTALAVKDGKIAALGSDEELLQLDGEKIDLGGRTLYAGFADSHMHLLHFGITLTEVELKNARSIEEVIALGKKFIEENNVPAGQFISCHGWNQDLFPDKHIPTREDLDRISTEHPIVASRICGHLATANTAALKLFGITKDTRVDGGEIYLDENGEPNGVVSENALMLFDRSAGSVAVEEVMDILRLSARYAASKGITCVHSDDLHSMSGCSGETVIEAFKRLAEEDDLAVRVYQQCQLITDEEFSAFFAQHKPGQQYGVFNLHSLKILSDGSLGGRTAALKQDYADAPGNTGILCFEPERLEEMVEIAHCNNMPVAVHAIGDRAIDLTLNAIEKAQKAHPGHDLKHGVIHCQITDEAILDRFKTLNAQAYVQPVFLEYDAHIVDDRVGKELGATSYNWKSLLQRGVNVSGGSDCPVENMDSLPNFYCAMTRMDFDGKPAGGYHPEQNLTAQETLRIFTHNTAKLTGDEDHRGDLKLGFDADFTVLDEDYFDVSPDHIKDVSVYMTVMGGKIRYRA